jgi:hypothetical protein
MKWLRYAPMLAVSLVPLANAPAQESLRVSVPRND